MEQHYEVYNDQMNQANLKPIPLSAAKLVDVPVTEQRQDSVITKYIKKPFRKVVRAKITVHNRLDPEGITPHKEVAVTLAGQRKHKQNEPWRDADYFTLSQLLSGEEARLVLDADETRTLYETLRDLYAVMEEEPSGERRAYVVRSGVQARLTSQSDLIAMLSKCDQRVWDDLLNANVDLTMAFALHKIHAVRKKAVEAFEYHVGATE